VYFIGAIKSALKRTPYAYKAVINKENRYLVLVRSYSRQKVSYRAWNCRPNS